MKKYISTTENKIHTESYRIYIIMKRKIFNVEIISVLAEGYAKFFHEVMSLCIQLAFAKANNRCNTWKLKNFFTVTPAPAVS